MVLQKPSTFFNMQNILGLVPDLFSSVKNWCHDCSPS